MRPQVSIRSASGKLTTLKSDKVDLVDLAENSVKNTGATYATLELRPGSLVEGVFVYKPGGWGSPRVRDKNLTPRTTDYVRAALKQALLPKEEKYL